MVCGLTCAPLITTTGPIGFIILLISSFLIYIFNFKRLKKSE